MNRGQRVYHVFVNQVDYENLMNGNKHYLTTKEDLINYWDNLVLESENADTRNLFKVSFIEKIKDTNFISVERIR